MTVGVKTTENSDGTFDVSVNCKECGGSLTHADCYGMWCDKQCRRQASVDLAKACGVDDFFNSIELPQVMG